jgi:hypothetical protein
MYQGNRRVRFMLGFAAHAVIFSLVFQIFAFDHWQQGFDGVQGINGSSAHYHASHCHGDAAGCADSGGAAVNLMAPERLFAAPASRFMDAGTLSYGVQAPADPELSAPDQPPQAS